MELIDTKSPAGSRSVPTFKTLFSHEVAKIARRENKTRLKTLALK
jgi:hypothetical protein